MGGEMTTTATEPKITDDVLELVRQHGCEQELWSHIDMIEARFPDREGLSVRVTPDPDETGHCWIDLEVTLPATLTCADIQSRRLEYIDDVVKRIPPRLTPSFALAIRFAPE